MRGTQKLPSRSSSSRRKAIGLMILRFGKRRRKSFPAGSVSFIKSKRSKSRLTRYSTFAAMARLIYFSSFGSRSYSNTFGTSETRLALLCRRSIRALTLSFVRSENFRRSLERVNTSCTSSKISWLQTGQLLELQISLNT